MASIHRSLKLRKQIIIIILGILVLFSCNSLKINSFDLNELPLDEMGEEPLISGDPGDGGNDGGGNGTSTTKSADVSQEKLQKLAAIYVKILKLFKVLRICDDEHFDIEHIQVPNSWNEQYKAMMILAKVGKQKLIKKSDMARYKRIMTNCAEIQEVVQKRAESKLSFESQMSGLLREDVEKLRKQLEESPIEDLRNGLVSGKTTKPALNSQQNFATKHAPQYSWLQQQQQQQQTTTPNESFVITTSGNKRSREDSANMEPRLIHFL